MNSHQVFHPQVCWLFSSAPPFSSASESTDCNQWRSPTQLEWQTPDSVVSPNCCWSGKVASTRFCTRSSWPSSPCTLPSAPPTGEQRLKKGFRTWWRIQYQWKKKSVSFHSFRFLLHDDQKRYFEKLAIYCNHYASLIPMSFVLGEVWRCSALQCDIRLISPWWGLWLDVMSQQQKVCVTLCKITKLLWTQTLEIHTHTHTHIYSCSSAAGGD